MLNVIKDWDRKKLEAHVCNLFCIHSVIYSRLILIVIGMIIVLVGDRVPFESFGPGYATACKRCKIQELT